MSEKIDLTANTNTRLLAGRISVLLTMLHQFRTDGALLCHVLDIDPTQPKAEVLRQMVARIRALQAQAAAKPSPKIIYVSGKPKKPTRH